MSAFRWSAQAVMGARRFTVSLIVSLPWALLEN
jgi:hypothetical protein